MIEWVYNRVSSINEIDKTIVLTDNPNVLSEVEKFGGKGVLTSEECKSGTERIISSQIFQDFDITLNIQGDEPMISTSRIKELINLVSSPHVNIGTLYTKIEEQNDLFDYNVVKLVLASDNRVMYFSRQAIPAFRDLPYSQWIKRNKYFSHIGIYGYKRNSLNHIAKMENSVLESTESLEQLKWLENGSEIYGLETPPDGTFGIDTPEDLERLRKLLEK